MPNWEYKVITSGKGGFATPALLEKFLNDLGQDEWEIVEFRSSPDNVLAFAGLARRSTERDWTLEGAAAAAARAEADKLRAEFEAKFKGMSSQPAAAASTGDAATAAVEPKREDDGLRRLRDTDSDQDPEAAEPEDEWDKLSSEDELPTFFDAIRPHMRRNQRGPGLSVGVDQLARKWDFSEEDIKAALVECGFALPEDEDTRPAYIEYDGDQYWLNINRRGELWINTREKPRAVFRTTRGTPVPEPEPSAEDASRAPEERTDQPERPERQGRQDRQDRHRNGGPRQEKQDPSASGQPGAPLPEGQALLERIRPMMRRNRRGPGGSGSISFLSRALRCSEEELLKGFESLGLARPAGGQDKPAPVEIGENQWWLNQDGRGGVWINQIHKSAVREDRDEGGAGEPAQATASDLVGADLAAARSEIPGSDGSVGDSQPASRSEPDASPSGSDPVLPSGADTAGAADLAPARSVPSSGEPSAADADKQGDDSRPRRRPRPTGAARRGRKADDDAPKAEPDAAPEAATSAEG